MLTGNIYVYNQGGYLYVQAENCGDGATLTHNIFNTKAEADSQHVHDDNNAAITQGSGTLDLNSGAVRTAGLSFSGGHGTPVPAGTPDNPQYAAYRLRIGLPYRGTTVEPGRFVRVGFRGIADASLEIPREGEVKVLSYTQMNFRGANGVGNTAGYRGPAVPSKISGTNRQTSNIAALMMATKNGVMVNGQLRIVPKAHPKNAQQLLGWEIWFENNAMAPIPGSKVKTGFTGTIVMINPALPEDKNGGKNAGLGLESMACPEGGCSAMQFIRAGGDYGRADFGIEAQPGASFRAGIRGFSSYVGRLPSLQEGQRVVDLAQFQKGADVENPKFFDKDELEKKLGEKKNRVQFFKAGACINDKLAETIYRGMEAFQNSDLPVPRVKVEWVEDNGKYRGGGWRIVVASALPADPNDPSQQSCADKLGKLSFTATLKLKNDKIEGKDFTKLPTHKFLVPGEEHEWFLPQGTDLNGVTGEVGAHLVVGTRGMGWLGVIPLPAKGQPFDSESSDDVKLKTWELWETQHERARLYPDYVPN